MTMSFSLKKLFIGLIMTLAVFMIFPHVSSAGVLSRQPNNLGLVGYWSLNDGVGTQAGDASGNNHTLDLENGPTWTAGKKAGAVSFDGSNDTANVDTDDFDSFEQGSVSAWIKTSVGGTIVSYGSRSTQLGNMSWVCEVGCRQEWQSNPVAAWGVVETTTDIRDNQWHFITFVANGSSRVKIYIDGVEQSTTHNGQGSETDWIADTRTVASEPNNLQLGSAIRRIDGAAEDYNPRFTGTIDDVRIYNRALTATEITAMYTSGAITFKQPSKNGLVGHWNFDEGRGTSAGDVSGNGNTGTLTNGPVWTSGKVGGGLNFDGSNDYVSMGDVDVSGDAITVSAWIKPDTLSGFTAPVHKRDAYMFYLNGNVLRPSVFTNTQYDLTGSIQIPLNQWTHIVFTYDGSDIKGYVNGVSDGSTSASGNINDSSYDLRISGEDGTNSYNFDGLLDDVRIYNTALSASEVTNLYNTGAHTAQTILNVPQNNQLTNGLVGFWSFNGKDLEGTTAYDRSGNGNDGTLTNDPKAAIGKVGQALQFDGVDDYVTVVDDSTLDFDTGDFSISLWVKPATYAEGAGFIHKNEGGGQSQYWLRDESTNGSLRFMTEDPSGGTAVETSDEYLTLNEWQHIVATRNGSTVCIYKNGANSVCNSGTVRNVTNNAALRIGVGPGDTYLNGTLDEVRIYNRVLSASEILQLYNGGK